MTKHQRKWDYAIRDLAAAIVREERASAEVRAAKDRLRHLAVTPEEAEERIASIEQVNRSGKSRFVSALRL